jgi:hypothetical protein
MKYISFLHTKRQIDWTTMNLTEDKIKAKEER